MLPFRSAVPLPRVLRLVRTRGVKSLLLHYTGASAYAGPVWNETLATMRAVAPCSELPAVRLELRGVPATVVAPFFEVLLPRQLTGLSLTVRPFAVRSQFLLVAPASLGFTDLPPATPRATLQDVAVQPGDVLQLSPLLAARQADTWTIRSAEPFGLPACALESPLAGLAELVRLTSLTLDCLSEDAAADPDAWEYIVDGLRSLRTLRVGLCTGWTKGMFASLARLRDLHTLGLTGLPTADKAADDDGSRAARNALLACAGAIAALPGLRELALADFALSEGPPT